MHSTSEIHWDVCPPGTLQNLAGSLRARRRRRHNLKSCVVLSLVLGTGVVLWSTYSQSGEYDFGGIVCSEVRHMSEDYLHGRLAVEFSEKIDAHLLECPNCKPLMDLMRNKLSVTARKVLSRDSARARLAVLKPTIDSGI